MSTFEAYTQTIGNMFNIRNNQPCKIVGIGTMAIKMFDGKVCFLRDVQHIPDWKRNLIFLEALDTIDCC